MSGSPCLLPFLLAVAFLFAQAARAAPPVTPASAVPGTPAATAPADPIAERAQALNEAATLLGKAGAALQRGNRNFAEQLFSSAEIIVGAEALAELAPLFRTGAPPRVSTSLKVMPKDSAPQPAAVGNSEEEDPPEPKPKRGSLSGTLRLGDKALPGRGVVTLEPVQGKWRPRPPRDRVMEQRNREFAPRMLVVRAGSKVSFPNFDSVYHNVFSRSEAQAFDLGIYKNGQSRELTFDKEGVVRLGCNLHANMSAYIVVVKAPHYAITDERGGFKFRELPPGRYRLRAFGESGVKPASREITIAPDENSVTVSLDAETVAPSVDKFGAARAR
jgi:hypothetical protein